MKAVTTEELFMAVKSLEYSEQEMHSVLTWINEYRKEGHRETARKQREKIKLALAHYNELLEDGRRIEEKE
jgi:L-fucose isomerase-like protein